MMRFDLVERRRVALAARASVSGSMPADLLELVAERLADPHGLAAELDREAADRVVAVAVGAGQAGGGRTPLPMPFCTSFDQRSPHRLVVALALSMRREHLDQLLDALA